MVFPDPEGPIRPIVSPELKEYFEFYNFERGHQSLVGKEPAEIYWGSEVARKAA